MRATRYATTVPGRSRLSSALPIAMAVALVVGVLPGFAEASADGLEAACPPELLEEADGTSFPDVSAGNAHAPAIQCIVMYGITQGRADGTFGPGLSLTRGQMATFLTRTIRASDTDLPGDDASFEDITTSVHRESIEQLAAAGIALGRTETAFEPDRSISRAQMATFLKRTFEFVSGTDLTTDATYFEDIAGNAHESSINSIAAIGFASGVSDSSFAPSRDVQRDQMASFLARMLSELVERGDVDVPGPPATYLSEERPVERSVSTRLNWGSAQIDTVAYARSVRAQPGAGTLFAEYSINRDYDVFRATVGLEDDAPADGRLQFDVFVDGSLATSTQLGLGESEDIEVDVSDALRLRVAFSHISDAGTTPGAFGDAQVVRNG